MSNEALNDLLNYIDFLRGIGYFVSISGFEKSFEPYINEFFNYEVHPHTVCFYLKQNKATTGLCIKNKAALDKTKISEPYYSCCFAGVEEYVVPIMYNDRCIMRVNISGFRGTLKKSGKFMQRASRLCDSNFVQYYNELSLTPPTLDEILKFVKPLEYIAIKLYNHCKEISGITDTMTRQLYNKAIQYIQENYMLQISCNDLANYLNYSVSYLQYIFKKEASVTIKAQINNIRLNNAAFMLLNSKMNITEISYSCGFTDSNYFSSAFKSHFGISPKKYRQQGAFSK